MKCEYSMPPAKVGPCLWYPSREADPVPALVTQVGKRSVNLTLFAPDNRAGIPKDGVRHKSDPDIDRLPDVINAGCWDYTDDQKQLAATVELMAQIASKGKAS